MKSKKKAQHFIQILGKHVQNASTHGPTIGNHLLKGQGKHWIRQHNCQLCEQQFCAGERYCHMKSKTSALEFQIR